MSLPQAFLKLRGSLKLLIVALILMMGVAIGVPLYRAGLIYEYQDSVDGVHLPDVDALVCLAGGRGRIAAAGDVWYRYWEAHQGDESLRIPALYISGMGGKANLNVLKRQLRAGVRDVIQPENIIMEKESFNTEANARWLARFVRERNWKRILLITSPYHMMRAEMIFQKVFEAEGLTVRIDTLSAFQEPFEPSEWRKDLHGIHVTLVEYLKWVYYRYGWKPSKI